ncbi:phytoene desaturase family protein [Microvirga antarctica]|uniref:phytoene desaturase family protein n=1 Tax=Microvirga antarctica TaxID=2819233 RepID=UPI001B31173E|nr:NAD(P)/FAD-dependent oxidoreductase [Microvirga antarctica]
MLETSKDTGHRFDAIIVGGGHNGLIAAAYLGRAGLKVAVLESRETLGGPCGTYEFMPGYRTAFTNSPGSFEPRFIQELDLASFGLTFVRTDPTVVHPFPSKTFIGWRDRDRIAAQLDHFAAGEAARYFAFLSKLETLGQHLGTSLFAPSPDLATIARHLPREQESLFNRVFFGSLRQILDEELRSEEAKALLGMVALNATFTPPSAPGTAVGLMMRPLSLASSPALDQDDPRRAALRGSTGLPLGGMGAIIDALEACCRHHGVHIATGARVAQVLHRDGRVTGVALAGGDEYTAPVVVSAINPRTLFADLLDDEAVGADIRHEVAAVPMRGSAFKLVLALDGLPHYAGLPADVSSEQAAAVQFRIAPSVDYIEKAVADGLGGRSSREPIMWGLIPSVTSPGLAPEGHHLLSVNVWHAPYDLREGDWSTERDVFGQRCIDTLTQFMPDLKDCIVDHRFVDPVTLQDELGLVHANITHGDMLPGALFGARPHRAAHDYRTPLKGFYLSGAGTWPGGYVTGIPGFNASNAVINDLAGQTRAGTSGE